MAPDEVADHFEERAAIMEFDGLMTRAEAERLALLDSESWRHACEARRVASMATDEERRDFLAAVEKNRGREAADKLRRDAWRAMRKGKQ